MFLLTGDVHGLFYDYKQILKDYKPDFSLQLGDMGVGFPDSPKLFLNDIQGKHYWLRGNHDNPEISRKHSNYIGDYGILKGSYIEDRFNKLFYISGAWSIDQEWRTPNISWWEDEQLSYEELCSAINKYNEEQPDIVCSHDCPTMVLHELYPSRGVIPTRTSQAMDTMFMSRKPSYWFFGHHHVSWRKNIDGCLFVALNELEIIDISKRINKIPY